MNILSDELRVIANRIRKQIPDKQIIGVTSSRRKEGKSEFILRMSEILKDYGKVLIMDCNFFESGLTSRGEECEQKENYIYMTDTPNIYVLPCSESLRVQGYVNIDEMSQVLQTVRSSFEYILVELPSFENVSYVQELSELVDGIILMMNKGRLKRDELSIIKEKMGILRSPIISCVFNENIKNKHNYLIKKEVKNEIPRIKVDASKMGIDIQRMPWENS